MMSPLQNFQITDQSSKMFRLEQWIYWYMQTKYELAWGFEGVEPFILDIKDQFQKVEGIIHHARNVLKKMEYDNLDLVVKSFAVPNYLNQVVYAFIRDSKAKRSFQYSMRLKELNIITYCTHGLLFVNKNTLIIIRNIVYLKISISVICFCRPIL